MICRLTHSSHFSLVVDAISASVIGHSVPVGPCLDVGTHSLSRVLVQVEGKESSAMPSSKPVLFLMNSEEMAFLVLECSLRWSLDWRNDSLDDGVFYTLVAILRCLESRGSSAWQHLCGSLVDLPIPGKFS